MRFTIPVSKFTAGDSCPQKIADVVVEFPDEDIGKAWIELQIEGKVLYHSPLTMWAYQQMLVTYPDLPPRAESGFTLS